MPAPERRWRAYLVRCADGSLYAGVSNDVAARLAAHNGGRGARYTRARLPVVLAWRSPPLDKSPAHRLEARLKRIPRADKQLLPEGVSARRRRVLAALLAGLREPRA
jgi:putative endonuclease